MDLGELFVEAFQKAIDQLETMIAQAITFLPQFVAGIIIFLLGWLLSRLTRRWARGIAARVEAPAEVENLIVMTVQVGTLLLAVTVALAAMGIKVYAVLTGLGVGGLVVGFALKDIIENLLAGVLLLIQQPFGLGDLIEVDGITGTVTRVQLRATTLQTLDNLEAVIPNRAMYTSTITNFRAYPLRRWAVTLGIGYGEDMPRVVNILLDAARGVAGVAQDPEPYVQLEDFGDSAVTGTLYYYSDQTRYSIPETRTAVLTAVERTVREQQFDLPYPTSVVISTGLSRSE
jgi:small-conductance mechanosensitive channel